MDFMSLALEQAKAALESKEVPVGCVIVKGSNKVVARGRNETNRTYNATRHAELVGMSRYQFPPKGSFSVVKLLTSISNNVRTMEKLLRMCFLIVMYMLHVNLVSCAHMRWNWLEFVSVF